MAFTNYEKKRGSGKKLKVHFDLPEDNDYPNHKDSSSSVSSESSSDSDESDNCNRIHNVDSKDVSYGSPVWSFQGGSVIQSPPLQFMSSPGYDPNRIPSSIFNKPTSPMDWSVASNDSLFSIHIGNNSFSRDYAFPFNNKSGELPRTSDLASMPTTLQPVQEVPAKDKNVEMERHSVSSNSSSESADSDRGHDHEKTSHETKGSTWGHDHEKTSHETKGSDEEVVDLKKTETSAEVGTDEKMLDKTPDYHPKEAKIPNEEPKDCPSASYLSIESDISRRSFQFPILTAVGGRTSSSTIKSEKQEKIEKQEEQPETPQKPPSPKTKKPPKQSGKSWCFCFSCSPCF